MPGSNFFRVGALGRKSPKALKRGAVIIEERIKISVAKGVEKVRNFLGLAKLIKLTTKLVRSEVTTIIPNMPSIPMKSHILSGE